MTEDKIKAEDIEVIWSNFEDSWTVIILTDSKEWGENKKQQILKNQEIVERLEDSIKSIEALADKDTIYEADSMRLKLVLPYLQSIKEGKK